MKEKREVDLSQKGTWEAYELSDDDMEQVIGGMMNRQAITDWSDPLSKCITDSADTACRDLPNKGKHAECPKCRFNH